MHPQVRSFIKSRILIVLMLGAVLLIGALPAMAQQETVAVRVKAHHLILSLREGELSVVEVLSFLNGGTKAAELEVVLPPGYRELQLVKGVTADKAQLSAKGFSVKDGIAPGESSVSFSYKLAKSDRGLTLSKRLSYDTDYLFVLLAEGQLRLATEGFTDEGPIELQGMKLHRYSRERLSKGTGVELKLTKVENASAGPSDQGRAASEHESEHILNRSFHGGNANVQLWMRVTGFPGHAGLTGIFFLTVFALILVWTGFKIMQLFRAREKGKARASRESLTELEEQKALLVKQIAELDMKHARGEMEEEAYLRTRESHKRRLMELMLKLKEARQT